MHASVLSSPPLSASDPVLRFELTAQFLDAEAQALAELAHRLTPLECELVMAGRWGSVRKQHLLNALTALRALLREAGFVARGAQ